MRITIDPISPETMKEIDAHCDATKTTREKFATAALEAAAKGLGKSVKSTKPEK